MKKTYQRGGGRPGKEHRFGGDQPWKKSFRGFDDGRKPIHAATCSKCGKECMVPFKPNGKKPVFCNTCFKKEDGASAGRFADSGSRDLRFDGPRDEESLPGQLKTINAKLDIILKALAPMTSPREKRTYKKR